MSLIDNFTDRYLPPDKLNPFLWSLKNLGNLNVLGYSQEKRPIYGYKVGKGPLKVLIWSQMHGNESTTTKAIIDLLYLIESGNHLNLLKGIKLIIIPQLNPDGAAIYSRYNANSVDLNRDFVNLTQSESKTLMKVFNKTNPDFCFNLHGQRTIYSAGKMGLPATLSFLAPASDDKGTISKSRENSMKLIASINSSMQRDIPNQIGRFDDSFNINCIGDKLSSLGVPTILFEAGHYPEDYNRNITRKHILSAILIALESIVSNSYDTFLVDDYFNIPENNKDYCDLVIEDVDIIENKNLHKNQDLVVNFKEILKGSKIDFEPEFISYSDSYSALAHKKISFKSLNFSNPIHFETINESVQIKNTLKKLLNM
mgnify:FL=1